MATSLSSTFFLGALSLGLLDYSMVQVIRVESAVKVRTPGFSESFDLVSTIAAMDEKHPDKNSLSTMEQRT